MQVAFRAAAHRVVSTHPESGSLKHVRDVDDVIELVARGGAELVHDERSEVLESRSESPINVVRHDRIDAAGIRQHVIRVIDVEDVVAETSVEPIGEMLVRIGHMDRHPPVERIVAVAADERIGARAADQRVVASAAVETVVARTAVQGVIAAESLHRVAAVAAGQAVVATRADDVRARLPDDGDIGRR